MRPMIYALNPCHTHKNEQQRHWVLTHDVGDDTLTPMIIEAREEAEAPREAIITRNRQNGYGPDEDDSSAEETDVAASAV